MSDDALRDRIQREMVDSFDEEPDRVHNANYIRGPVPKDMFVPAIY